ncbi:MAG TPA: acetoacetate--CoA ligase [Kineosporiaceae bacterium]|nr:acetoacetate--CoA ligase [Kineosporiaceae bacterium]
MSEPVPDVVWTPDPREAQLSAIAGFARFVADRAAAGPGPLQDVAADPDVCAALVADPTDYAALHAWSVRDLPGFWSAVAQYLGVRFHARPSAVLEPGPDGSLMPGARWFPGSTLNYAEHALTPGPGRGDGDVAIVAAGEDVEVRTVTYAQLRDQVARARAGLQRLGVGRGDRVVALVPNGVETLVTFLAVASLGAIWSSCSADFGVRAARDRFAQIEPAVLVAVEGYRYGGRHFDVRPTVRALQAELPTLRATVLLPPPAALPEAGTTVDGALTWAELTAVPAEPAFEAVPFDHPLWVLYSSGTTGLPKGIVQGHGGIVLEHLKALRLQLDLGPGDRFFWFTTTGWMMWNFLISGLLAGATVVLYDGNPGYPDLGALWRLAEQHRITYFGTSAPFVQACLKAGLRPRELADLSGLRALGSTGSPLSVEGFRWIAEAVGERIQICSVSGGTDVCTAFLGTAPTVPVWLGELSCAGLGADVVAYDPCGREVVDEVGELVITGPTPSMPVSFWNDPDGSRLRAAYYEDYPGVWRHGDWVRRTPRGSYVIYGRSDATLNRGGVRMGTADFYAVVEGFGEVADSLVVDTTELAAGQPGAATEGELLCFLVLAAGARLEDVEPRLRKALRAELSPRHVPDRFIVIDAVPRTLSGKKCEVPVKKILAGADPDTAVSRGALQNPDSLAAFLALARRPAAG